ncbi:hypothetical protein JAAARDRAFT_36328 [Jaapia argillacea MUCL 33604]|uniref:Uncharacterized protein n=1 Tax=Jaapia argillacea MUCL 33604 TaxID=933084 RepID=A0A067PPZ7_9AGAM|nr:hypothetical protein JAAARDRAFT_36328 [Jaapia argillacea MUCL 33604]
MEDLPIDTRNPAVRDYLALIRLQVLTPLSLLINIATVLICTVMVDPGIGQVSKLYPNPLTPSNAVIAMYATLVYIGQIGYCLLLVFARKKETKQTFLKGVGLALVSSNWVIAFWAIAFVFQSFLLATILLGLLLVLLIYANLVLLIYHHPSSHGLLGERPMDLILIHAPVRLFLVGVLGDTFALVLFITLGYTYSPGEPQHYARYQTPAFVFLLLINLLGLLVIMVRRDVVWCVGATLICISIWVERPKPFIVYITTLLFTIIHPLGLVAAALWHRLKNPSTAPRRGPIALPPDQEGRPQVSRGDARLIG